MIQAAREIEFFFGIVIFYHIKALLVRKITAISASMCEKITIFDKITNAMAVFIADFYRTEALTVQKITETSASFREKIMGIARLLGRISAAYPDFFCRKTAI